MKENSSYIYKGYNVTVLLYNLICSSKYRKVAFSEPINARLKAICLEIEKRYEIVFLELGANKGYIHFLLLSVPAYRLQKVAKTIKRAL